MLCIFDRILNLYVVGVCLLIFSHYIILHSPSLPLSPPLPPLSPSLLPPSLPLSLPPSLPPSSLPFSLSPPLLGVCQIACVCLQLKELDVSGCLSLSNQSLQSLQEAILHMWTPPRHNITLMAGGRRGLPQVPLHCVCVCVCVCVCAHAQGHVSTMKHY